MARFDQRLWRTRPFQVDPWLDLPPPEGEPFPLEGFEFLDDEILRLASMIDPSRNPGGTTVLVTGDRGAGKTSLVNASIFHASLLARFEDGWIETQGTDARTLTEGAWNHWRDVEQRANEPVPKRGLFSRSGKSKEDDQKVLAQISSGPREECAGK